MAQKVRELPVWGTAESGESGLGVGMGAPGHFPHFLPNASLPSGCSSVMSFYNKSVI